MGNNHDRMVEEELALENGEERRLALARFLEIPLEDVEEMAYGDGRYFAAGGLGDYAVLSDDEAQELAEDEIQNNLWAFHPEFLARYVANGALTPTQLERLVGDSGESSNDALIALVGDRLGELVSDAIDTDGRGIFLAGYDFEENESEEIDEETFYIYRTN